jgi:LmbE family N-acetylglucosaminyl deacetylase
MTIQTFMVVLAHPDDESFPIGGTLAKAAATGHRVHLVTATRGEAGIPGKTSAETAVIREAELRRACAELGYSSLPFSITGTANWPPFPTATAVTGCWPSCARPGPTWWLPLAPTVFPAIPTTSPSTAGQQPLLTNSSKKALARATSTTSPPLPLPNKAAACPHRRRQ